jgi:hypothetical protein
MPETERSGPDSDSLPRRALSKMLCPLRVRRRRAYIALVGYEETTWAIAALGGACVYHSAMMWVLRCCVGEG